MKTWPYFPKSRKAVDLDTLIANKFKLKDGEKLPEISIVRTLRFLQTLVGVMVSKGANAEEISAVLFYCKVVLDCKKSRLNWLKAYEYFGIENLEKLYGFVMSEQNKENNDK